MHACTSFFCIYAVDTKSFTRYPHKINTNTHALATIITFMTHCVIWISEDPLYTGSYSVMHSICTWLLLPYASYLCHIRLVILFTGATCSYQDTISNKNNLDTDHNNTTFVRLEAWTSKSIHVNSIPKYLAITKVIQSVTTNIILESVFSKKTDISALVYMYCLHLYTALSMECLACSV